MTPTIHLIQWKFWEIILRLCFAGRFPGVEVVPDRKFLQHVKSTLLYPGELGIACGVFSPCDRELLNKAMETVGLSVALQANQTLALVQYFGGNGTGLNIEEAESPITPGDEIEKNLLLGRAIINNTSHLIFVEHEWKNVNGAIRRQIHLHARPMATQTWDHDDNLSIVVID